MPPNTSMIAVPIDIFRRFTRDINFDVYLKLSEDNVAHVFSRTTGLDYKRLATYVQKGISHLFIREEDRKLYEEFMTRPADAVFSDPNAPAEKKIAALLNMTEQNMSEIFSQHNVRDETVASTQKLVSNYVDLMTQNPQTLAVILKLVSHGEYLYYHSIAVSIFSLFIGKACGQFDRKMLELIGMGGFLHDIGCTQLPQDVLASPNEFTEGQWDVFEDHPKLGLQMLADAKSIPEEVRYIVYQHHEEPSGAGYPNGIQNSSIYYPARVVALADAFSALISKQPYRPAYTAEQAIRILQKERDRFDQALVGVLASIILQQGKGQKAA